MNNQKVKLTNKLVNGFKSNTFTADGKKGKAYFIQEKKLIEVESLNGRAPRIKIICPKKKVN